MVGNHGRSVIHFYGFDKRSKATFPSLTLKIIKEHLEGLNDEDIEDLHLSNNDETAEDNPVNIVMSESDGRDIFRTIKTRQGQYKSRKLLLQNYQSKCALCNISHPRLLITSHIEPWSKSSIKGRVDPRNGILLCKIHDALFENGFISFDDNYRILFSSTFDFAGQGISKELIFRNPIKDAPSTILLKGHRVTHRYE